MKTNADMNSSKILKLAAKTLFFGAIAVGAQASSQRCEKDVAKSSVYFVPHIKDYCDSPKPCAAFKKQVKMQGSGTLPGNKLLTYSGKKVDLGDCETAFGASGECLIPFISVAADPKFYRMGDIIEMPSMKGKEIALPNGKTMTHPGFFIVHDTGGAIKGRNRFDFFTGSYNYTDPENVFGTAAAEDMKMTDVADCAERKLFGVVRRDYDIYQAVVAKIEDAVQGASAGSSSMIASTSQSYGTGTR